MLGQRAGPSSLRGWPAFGGPCQLSLSVMLLLQATAQREGGKVEVDFPSSGQTSEIVGDCGRSWEIVGNCGRSWEIVGDCG